VPINGFADGLSHYILLILALERYEFVAKTGNDVVKKNFLATLTLSAGFCFVLSAALYPLLTIFNHQGKFFVTFSIDFLWGLIITMILRFIRGIVPATLSMAIFGRAFYLLRSREAGNSVRSRQHSCMHFTSSSFADGSFGQW